MVRQEGYREQALQEWDQEESSAKVRLKGSSKRSGGKPGERALMEGGQGASVKGMMQAEMSYGKDKNGFIVRFANHRSQVP